MNKNGDLIRTGVAISVIVAFGIATAHAQEQSDSNQLLVPEDLTIQGSDELPSPDGSQNMQFEEVRIGGRLERVTVHHRFGITEIYQNQRADELWSADEKELGEIQNVRQWKLGGW